MTRNTLLVSVGCLLAACSSKPPSLPFGSPDSGGASGSGANAGSGSGTAGAAGGAGLGAQGGGAGTAGGSSGAAGSAGVAGTGLAGSSGAGGGSAGGGTGGVSGGAGSAGAAGSGGTPITAGPPYTFPQNYQSSYCTRPAGASTDVAQAAYTKFRAELVTPMGANGNLRVTRPGTELDTTVSEGIGYGMILAVVMDDQATFDALWKYEQAHLDKNGLMNWKIDPSGTVSTDGMGAATDADEDMAWALLQADRKWHGTTYLAAALTQIDNIWNHEVDHTRGGLLLAGDSWGMVVTHNPSYFAPNQYRRFGIAANKTSDWNSVIDRNYTELMNTLQSSVGNQNNGLVPPWADENGKVMQPFVGAPTYYQYDSARVPFRIAQDYCDFGEARAKTYLDKVSAFFMNEGASMIVDGYALNGTKQGAHALPVQSALFIGAAGVAAMSDPAKAAFVSQTWQLLAAPNPSATVLLPESYYFNLSWLVFSTLMMTGNLYDYGLK